jgi:hypothetical protein
MKKCQAVGIDQRKEACGNENDTDADGVLYVRMWAAFPFSGTESVAGGSKASEPIHLSSADTDSQRPKA